MKRIYRRRKQKTSPAKNNGKKKKKWLDLWTQQRGRNGRETMIIDDARSYIPKVSKPKSAHAQTNMWMDELTGLAFG